MINRPVICVIAAVLLSAASAAQSEVNALGAPVVKGTSSVAEMLQRKQETQLREQLTREGRWDEVRKLDEAQAKRQQERKEQLVAQVNGELSRSAKTESASTTALLDVCDKETLRLRQMKSANVDKSPGETASF